MLLLLWCIFYNSLLCHIESNENVGYKVQTEEITDWARQSYRKSEMRFSVLASTNDMTWIAESKSQLRKITEIASDFFRINDIQINGKKFKLNLKLKFTQRKKVCAV